MKGPRKAPAKAAESARGDAPKLVDLVRRHLDEQKEPRSAAEVATALGQAHPGRTIKVTVVRSTLEGLVARNQAQRSKQGTSVFYTAPDGSTPPRSVRPTHSPEAGRRFHGRVWLTSGGPNETRVRKPSAAQVTSTVPSSTRTSVTASARDGAS